MYNLFALASLSYGFQGTSIADQIDRYQFERDGYFIVNDILSEEEINEAVAEIDQLLPPDAQPPLVCGTGGELNGRKALRGDYCEPRLSNLAGHPRLIEAAEMLLGGPATNLPHLMSGGHVQEPAGGRAVWNQRSCGLAAHSPRTRAMRNTSTVCYTSATVEPSGGAFILRPGSHHFVQRCLENPDLRERAVAQEFKGMDGLQERKAMCVPAGSAVFFHAFMVHDRSENVLDVPRRVMFAHFVRSEDGESIEDRSSAFHSDQVRSMDNRMRTLVRNPRAVKTRP